MDSIQIGTAPLLLFIASIVGFISMELYIIKKISKINSGYINKKINKIIMVPLFLIVISDKISYGLLSLFSKNEIISKFKVIPLYQPLILDRFAAKYFGFKVDKEAKNIIQKQGLLNYPISPIKLKTTPNKINIFIFASDATRGSIINNNVTPNIIKFKQDSISFPKHYSGGNATRFGIFSLIYSV